MQYTSRFEYVAYLCCLVAGCAYAAPQAKLAHSGEPPAANSEPDPLREPRSQLEAIRPLLESLLTTVAKDHPERLPDLVRAAKVQFTQELGDDPAAVAGMRWWLCDRLLESVPAVGLRELAELEVGPTHSMMNGVRVHGISAYLEAGNRAAAESMATKVYHEQSAGPDERGLAAAYLAVLAPNEDAKSAFVQEARRLFASSKNAGSGVMQAFLAGMATQDPATLGAAMRSAAPSAARSSDPRVRALFPIMALNASGDHTTMKKEAADALTTLKQIVPSDASVHISDLLAVVPILFNVDPSLALDAVTEAERFAQRSFRADSDEVRLARTFRAKTLRRIGGQEEALRAYGDLDLAQQYKTSLLLKLGRDAMTPAKIVSSVEKVPR